MPRKFSDEPESSSMSLRPHRNDRPSRPRCAVPKARDASSPQPNPNASLYISPYMTVPEAAVYAKTTPWAVAQAIRAGELQAKKIGKRFVTRIEWVDDWFSRAEDAG
jgi:hypothetical protein